MAEKEDIEIGNRFKIFRKAIAQSQEILALELDVSQSYIAGIETGRNKMPNKIARHMMNRYDLSLDWLMNGKGSMYVHDPEFFKKKVMHKGNVISKKGNPIDSEGLNVIMVPVSAQASSMGMWTQEWIDQNLVKTSLPGITEPAMAFEVSGDSMIPTVHPGDYVVGRKLEAAKDIREARVHIVVSRTSGIYIKRIYHDNDFLVLESDNDLVPPVVLPVEDVHEVYYAIQRITHNFSGPRPNSSRLSRVEGFLTKMFPEFKSQDDLE